MSALYAAIPAQSDHGPHKTLHLLHLHPFRGELSPYACRIRASMVAPTPGHSRLSRPRVIPAIKVDEIPPAKAPSHLSHKDACLLGVRVIRIWTPGLIGATSITFTPCRTYMHEEMPLRLY